MAMTRQQLRLQTMRDRAKAAKHKPLERRRVRAYMEPVTRAFAMILQGVVEVDDNDVPITRLSSDDEWHALDECIEGFIAVVNRLMPEIDTKPLHYVASDLHNGKAMNPKKARAAWETLRAIEDNMTRYTWQQVIDATNTTMIEAKLEAAGLKEAA